MLKKILAVLAFLYVFVAQSLAAVEVNKATATELDAIKGIGPAISARIVEERKKGSFKDWDDFITRVQGVGEKTAAKFSEQGLTVNNTAFQRAASKQATDTKAKSNTKAATAEGAGKDTSAATDKAAKKSGKPASAAATKPSAAASGKAKK